MARGNKTKYQDVLSQQDCELFERVLTAYERMRLGSMRYELSYVKRDSQVIKNLVCFTGLPPWQWADEHCSDWGQSLEERNFNIATQRTYQAGIKRFLKFQCSNYYLVHEIERLTGYTPLQVTDDVKRSDIYRNPGHRYQYTTEGYCLTEEDIERLARKKELREMKPPKSAVKKVLVERRKRQEKISLP